MREFDVLLICGFPLNGFIHNPPLLLANLLERLNFAHVNRFQLAFRSEVAALVAPFTIVECPADHPYAIPAMSCKLKNKALQIAWETCDELINFLHFVPTLLSFLQNLSSRHVVMFDVLLHGMKLFEIRFCYCLLLSLLDEFHGCVPCFPIHLVPDQEKIRTVFFELHDAVLHLGDLRELCIVVET